MGCCYSQKAMPDGSYPRHPANGPEECGGFGWYYDPQPCRTCPLLWHALNTHYMESYAGDEIAFRSLSLITTSIFDIRYYLLVNSELGRSLLQSYGEHSAGILSLIQDDRSLMRRITGMFLDAVGFGQDMLRVHLLGGEVPSAGHIVYDGARHAAAITLLGDVRAALPSDSNSIALLNLAEQFLNSVVGMSSAEVLAMMQVRPVAESKETVPPEVGDLPK